jgi:hypothetical protein
MRFGVNSFKHNAIARPCPNFRLFETVSGRGEIVLLALHRYRFFCQGRAPAC